MSNKEIEMSDMSTVKVDIELPKGQVYNNEYIDPTILTDKENEKVKKVIPLREEKKVTAVGFAINLLKGIAGTGSLAIPLAMKSVGIIPGLILFFVVSVLYIYSSYQLITLQSKLDSYTGELSTVKTNNDYARICYIALGKPGYYLFNVALLVTLYGACIGTMIVCTDFLSCLPFLNDRPFLKKLVSQIILAVCAILCCMLKDISLVVKVSSFGLFALASSFVLLFYYGITNFQFSFNRSYLWPVSTTAFLNNFGIFIYSLGFSLLLLSQVKNVRSSHRQSIVKTLSVSVFVMAVLYAIIGVVFFTLFETSGEGVKGNILLSLPKGHWTSVLISLLMVFTCVGGFPVYMTTIHEVVERKYKENTTKSIFILDKNCWIFRSSEFALISIIAFFIPSFSDILSFNILFIFIVHFFNVNLVILLSFS